MSTESKNIYFKTPSLITEELRAIIIELLEINTNTFPSCEEIDSLIKKDGKEGNRNLISLFNDAQETSDEIKIKELLQKEIKTLRNLFKNCLNT